MLFADARIATIPDIFQQDLLSWWGRWWGISSKAADSGNVRWVRGWNAGLFEKVDHKQAEKQKEERKKEKEERKKEKETKRANFKKTVVPRRQLHEEGHVAKDVVVAAALMEELGQPGEEDAPAAEKEGEGGRNLYVQSLHWPVPRRTRQ